ncbi:hypothetical protein JQK62_25655, partial [Leptospira santarosai]|nr:hypothetical protein [Leptospira santarosai]
ASALKANTKDVVARVQGLQQELRQVQRENESLSAKIANSQASSILDKAQQIDGVTVLAARVQSKDNNQLRQMMDDLKTKMTEAVIVLGASEGDK